MKKITIIVFACVLAIACNNNELKNDQATTEKKDSVTTATDTISNDPFAKNGEETIKYDNGIVKMHGYYLKGKKEGQWNSWYSNGLPWSETYFEKGIKNGPTKAWYENGKIRYEGAYKNDAKTGYWSYYEENGKLSERVNHSK